MILDAEGWKLVAFVGGDGNEFWLVGRDAVTDRRTNEGVTDAAVADDAERMSVGLDLCGIGGLVGRAGDLLARGAGAAAAGTALFVDARDDARCWGRVGGCC